MEWPLTCDSGGQRLRAEGGVQGLAVRNSSCVGRRSTAVPWSPEKGAPPSSSLRGPACRKLGARARSARHCRATRRPGLRQVPALFRRRQRAFLLFPPVNDGQPWAARGRWRVSARGAALCCTCSGTPRGSCRGSCARESLPCSSTCQCLRATSSRSVEPLPFDPTPKMDPRPIGC